MFQAGHVGGALVVPRIRVDNVNVAANSLVIGPPGPTALVGLMHKIDLDLGETGARTPEEGITGIALICHDFEVATGHRRIPVTTPGEAKAGASAMLDEPEGRLLCSLVLSVSANSEDTLARMREALDGNLLRYRVAGGRIVHDGRTTCWVEAAHDEDEFWTILRSLPPGSVIADQTALLETTPDDPRDALDRLLDLLALRGTTDNKGRPRWVRNQRGWLVPVPIGWAPLSKTARRPGMRQKDGVVGHAWVEPVTGVGEWISTARAFRHEDKQLVFWRHAPASAQGPFLVEACHIGQV